MSIEGVHNDLFEANRDLDAALLYGSNSHSAGIRLCEDKAYLPLSRSLDHIDSHVAESTEALELAEAAMNSVRNISSLDHLTLPAMKGAKDKVLDAGEKFTAATKLVEMIIETTMKIPDILAPIPTILNEYVRDGNAILEFAQIREEKIQEAKAHIGTALEGDPLIP